MDAGRWKNKVCVVTGASVGIGAELAKRLADFGIVVVGLARRVELIRDISTTGIIHPLQCDLTVEEEVLKAFRWIEANLGGVDILINNAGVLTSCSLLDGNIQDFRTMFELNVLSLSLCTRESIKSMRLKDESQIIQLNSIAGRHVPHANGISIGPYSATKFAVTSLTESFRNEVKRIARNIKVTDICPGPVDTDMLRKLSASDGNSAVAELGVLKTSDVADLVFYILGTRPAVEIAEVTLTPVTMDNVF